MKANEEVTFFYQTRTCDDVIKSIRHLHFTISLSHTSSPIGKYLSYLIFHIC